MVMMVMTMVVMHDRPSSPRSIPCHNVTRSPPDLFVNRHRGLCTAIPNIHFRIVSSACADRTFGRILVSRDAVSANRARRGMRGSAAWSLATRTWSIDIVFRPRRHHDELLRESYCVLNDDDDVEETQRIIKYGSVRSSDDNIGQYDVTPRVVVVDAALIGPPQEDCAVWISVIVVSRVWECVWSAPGIPLLCRWWLSPKTIEVAFAIIHFE